MFNSYVAISHRYWQKMLPVFYLLLVIIYIKRIICSLASKKIKALVFFVFSRLLYTVSITIRRRINTFTLDISFLFIKNLQYVVTKANKRIVNQEWLEVEKYPQMFCLYCSGWKWKFITCCNILFYTESQTPEVIIF